jgi:DNA-binding response OmpR family regulator
MKRNHKSQQTPRPARNRVARTPSVLCVDDDPGIVSAIELRLKRYDVQVLGSYTGMQGYWEAITHRPDLVITDLRMPQGDGTYLLECLKQNPKTSHIPVLVFSGLRENDLAERVRHLGGETLLQKPIRGEELVNTIRRFIDLREKTEPTN